MVDVTQLLPLITLGLQIWKDHSAQGTVLTPEQVAQMVLDQLNDNDSAIAQEFDAKGWPRPQ